MIFDFHLMQLLASCEQCESFSHDDFSNFSHVQTNATQWLLLMKDKTAGTNYENTQAARQLYEKVN